MRHLLALLALLALTAMPALGDVVTFTPSDLNIAATSDLLDLHDYYASTDAGHYVSLRFRDQSGGLVKNAWQYNTDDGTPAFKTMLSKGGIPQLRLYGNAAAGVNITRVEIDMTTQHHTQLTVVAKVSDSADAVDAPLTTTTSADGTAEYVDIADHSSADAGGHKHTYVTITNESSSKNAHITAIKVTFTALPPTHFHDADGLSPVPLALTLKPVATDISLMLQKCLYGESNMIWRSGKDTRYAFSNPRLTNSSVASADVSADGHTVTVTPHAAGETELRLTATDGENWYAPCEAAVLITVAEAPLTVHFKNLTQSVTYQGLYAEMNVFDTKAFSDYIDYIECDGTRYTDYTLAVLPNTDAETNHPDVAYATADNHIVATRQGRHGFPLSISVEGYDTPATDMLPVYVHPAHPVTVSFDTQLSKYSVEQQKSVHVRMKAVYNSATITDHGPTYTYASSDTNVATVTADGTVTGVNPGTAVITVTATLSNDWYFLGETIGGSGTETLTKEVTVKAAATEFAEVRFTAKSTAAFQASVGDRLDIRDLITVEGRTATGGDDDWRTLTRYTDLPLHLSLVNNNSLESNDFLSLDNASSAGTITVAGADDKDHQVWVTFDATASGRYPLAGHEGYSATGKGTFSVTLHLARATAAVSGPSQIYVRRNQQLDLSTLFTGQLTLTRGRTETAALTYHFDDGATENSHARLAADGHTLVSDQANGVVTSSPVRLYVTIAAEKGMREAFEFRTLLDVLPALPLTQIKEGSCAVAADGKRTYALTLSHNTLAIPQGYTARTYWYTDDGSDPRTSTTRREATLTPGATTAAVTVTLDPANGEAIRCVNAVIDFSKTGDALSHYGEPTSLLIKSDDAIDWNLASHTETDADGKTVTAYDDVASLSVSAFEDNETGRPLCYVTWGQQYNGSKVGGHQKFTQQTSWGTPKNDTGAMSTHRLITSRKVSLIPGENQCDAMGELWNGTDGRFSTQFGATLTGTTGTDIFTPYATTASSQFDIPTKGSYFKVEPQRDGHVTIVARMNGCFDTGSSKSPGKTRRRFVYVCDEHGSILPIAGAQVGGVTYDANSGVEAIYHTGMPVSDRNDNISFWKLTDKAIDASSATEQDKARSKEHMSLYRQALGINNRTWNTMTGDNLLANDSQPLGSTDETTYYNRVIGDTRVNGYCTINTAYVAFRWPVKAGKTYFLMGNTTKIGAAGMMFEPAKGYQATELAVPAADFSSASLTDSHGQYRFQKGKAYNVLLERKFTKGAWASLVLPFSVSARELRATFGDDVSVLHLRDVRGTTLRFIHHYHQMLPAGTPVFLRPSAFPKADGDPQTVSAVRLDNVTWEGAQQAPAAPAAFQGNDQEGNYIFHITEPTATATADWQLLGTYTTATMPAGSWYVSGGKIVQCTKPTAMGPTRCWLQQGADNSAGARLSGNMTFLTADDLSDDAVALEIHGITDTAPAATAQRQGTYTLSGQKVAPQALRPGLYIINGKKTVIR